jgi:hypothetical protein
MRPGISNEMLARAGVRHVSADEAKALCGLAEAGLWLPYRDLDGNAIRDDDEDYGRLRLDQPQEKQKYHQAAGTTVHAYLPPTLSETPSGGGDLFIIEGEFKSLALTEAGFPAVGISGFYGFGLKDNGGLVPELAAVIEQRKPTRILFCGDADTALNHLFAIAALRLANLVKPIAVVLPRIPVNSPGKGADDCRAVLNEKFADWWQERIAKAVLVNPDTSWPQLALELFEAETEAIAKIEGAARMALDQRLVKFAASFKQQSLLQGRIRTVATKQLGLARRDFDRAVTKLEKRIPGWQGRQHTEGRGREINHDQPAAVWVREAWAAVSELLYQYAKQTCRLHQGQLQPQSPAAMVSFLDDPDRCLFQTRDRNGEEVRSNFTEADARIFLASWMEVSELVQTVEVFSSVPVLAWDGQQAALVNGYNRALRILAGGTAVTLPSPREAVALLVRLLQDYDFVTHGDLGRAMALLLSPALAQGGFLGKGRVPLFLVEKNEASAGGSLLLRLTAHIYGLRPQPISKLDKPDKVGEDISRLLLSGAGFLYFDNARGRGLEKLPELESLLTEPIFTCRAPYLHGEADVTRRVLAVSSNGAVFSRDLATRTVKISIRKQPAGYAWADYSDGSIEDHVVANAAHYLGAAFSLVKDWADQGRPVGKHLTGFRFSQWERACAWILERHFPGLPLLDASHQEAQEHLSDPNHDFLRNLFRLVVEGESRGELTASSLAEIATAAGLLEGDEQQNRMKIGKVMKSRFPQDGQHTFDAGNFTVERDTRMSTSGNGHEVAFYRIHRKESVQ